MADRSRPNGPIFEPDAPTYVPRPRERLARPARMPDGSQSHDVDRDEARSLPDRPELGVCAHPCVLQGANESPTPHSS
jgi:hypothetical protein